MAAGVYDFTIEQGATFSKTLAWRDSAGTLIDTSGYTARLQVRETVDSGTTLLDLTDGNGITLGIAGSGDDQYNVKISLTSVQTAALTFTEGRTKAVYDLELSGGGVVTRLLKGHVTLDKEVTR